MIIYFVFDDISLAFGIVRNESKTFWRHTTPSKMTLTWITQQIRHHLKLYNYANTTIIFAGSQKCIEQILKSPKVVTLLGARSVKTIITSYGGRNGFNEAVSKSF